MLQDEQITRLNGLCTEKVYSVFDTRDGISQHESYKRFLSIVSV